MSTARLIDKDYVATGKVKVVARHRAVLTADSQLAAEAALCAGDEGKYWDYSDKLSEALLGGNRAAFTKDGLKKVAADIGLNPPTFAGCLDGGKYAAQVKSETEESTKRGVGGTPTFYVNEVQIVGAQPFEVFKAAIDVELAKP